VWAKSPKREGGLNRNRGAVSPEIRGRIQPKYAGCARLVLASKERLFLVRPVKGAPDLELHTVVVPWSDIKALRITDQYTSCE
jgi:hypothetical protein